MGAVWLRVPGYRLNLALKKSEFIGGEINTGGPAPLSRVAKRRQMPIS